MLLCPHRTYYAAKLYLLCSKIRQGLACGVVRCMHVAIPYFTGLAVRISVPGKHPLLLPGGLH